VQELKERQQEYTESIKELAREVGEGEHAYKITIAGKSETHFYKDPKSMADCSRVYSRVKMARTKRNGLLLIMRTTRISALKKWRRK